MKTIATFEEVKKGKFWVAGNHKRNKARFATITLSGRHWRRMRGCWRGARPSRGPAAHASARRSSIAAQVCCLTGLCYHQGPPTSRQTQRERNETETYFAIFVRRQDLGYGLL